MPTIGVAVAIPDPWATELQDYRTAVGDRTATMIPTHITLVPPTEVTDDELRTIEGHLGDVAAEFEGFAVHLRGTGTFRPVSPVVFVAVSQGISYTEMLARSVRDALDSPEPEFPFHPHVTVAHNLDDPSLDRAYDDLRDFECQFTVTEFALYHHQDDAGWVPQRAFPLSQ